MLLQNRVQPDGQIIASPICGMFTRNRGILHVADGVMGKTSWRHKAWICCTLNWENRKRPMVQGHKWNELFFLNEAVAYVAGHRPCAYCRRAKYRQFQSTWQAAFGVVPKARHIDETLRDARIDSATRSQRTYQNNLSDLSDGTMAIYRHQSHLILGDAIYPYFQDGYGQPRSRQKETGVIVQTPRPLIALMRVGLGPTLHHTVRL